MRRFHLFHLFVLIDFALCLFLFIRLNAVKLPFVILLNTSFVTHYPHRYLDNNTGKYIKQPPIQNEKKPYQIPLTLFIFIESTLSKHSKLYF